jgi:hypothetical protein
MRRMFLAGLAVMAATTAGAQTLRCAFDTTGSDGRVSATIDMDIDRLGAVMAVKSLHEHDQRAPPAVPGTCRFA